MGSTDMDRQSMGSLSQPQRRGKAMAQMFRFITAPPVCDEQARQAAGLETSPTGTPCPGTTVQIVSGREIE